jgi:hypothetical protein
MESSPIPAARIVRKGGAVFTPPRPTLAQQIAPVTEAVKAALGYLIAFWPLTAVVLTCAALIWAAGYNAGP